MTNKTFLFDATEADGTVRQVKVSVGMDLMPLDTGSEPTPTPDAPVIEPDPTPDPPVVEPEPTPEPPPVVQPVYDYANDFYMWPNAGPDDQFRWDDEHVKVVGGCILANTTDGNKHKQYGTNLPTNIQSIELLDDGRFLMANSVASSKQATVARLTFSGEPDPASWSVSPFAETFSFDFGITGDYSNVRVCQLPDGRFIAGRRSRYNSGDQGSRASSGYMLGFSVHDPETGENTPFDMPGLSFPAFGGGITIDGEDVYHCNGWYTSGSDAPLGGATAKGKLADLVTHIEYAESRWLIIKEMYEAWDVYDAEMRKKPAERNQTLADRSLARAQELQRQLAPLATQYASKLEILADYSRIGQVPQKSRVENKPPLSDGRQLWSFPPDQDKGYISIDGCGDTDTMIVGNSIVKFGYWVEGAWYESSATRLAGVHPAVWIANKQTWDDTSIDVYSKRGSWHGYRNVLPPGYQPVCGCAKDGYLYVVTTRPNTNWSQALWKLKVK